MGVGKRGIIMLLVSCPVLSGADARRNRAQAHCCYARRCGIIGVRDIQLLIHYSSRGTLLATRDYRFVAVCMSARNVLCYIFAHAARAVCQ